MTESCSATGELERILYRKALSNIDAMTQTWTDGRTDVATPPPYAFSSYYFQTLKSYINVCSH